jgi:glyoxylase-like metal-dependent hydrolase (beta-lactamase superfamily II)
MITSTVVDFATDAPVPGNLDVRWIHGLRSRKDGSEPDFQVHAYDAHTYILRQSKTVSAEAPFLYLLFGNDRALLLDTGAGKQSEARPLRDVIDGLVAGWLAKHPRDGYELMVAHTHGHNDHVAGDGQFADRPATVVVSRELTAVQEFFGFTDWPKQPVSFDLGGRVLEIAATPGHHRAAITTYDPWTGFLITGDTVLPGRLLAFDFPAFLDSIERLVEFTETHEVTHVMGCHIEMTREPGRDYPLGCTYQPDEPPLQMTVGQLTAIRDAARSVADKPGAHVFDDFRIYNGPFKGYIVPMMLRGLVAKVLPTRRG